MGTEEEDKQLERERAMQTMEQLRHAVEKGYREMQETGDDGSMRKAQMRFKVRMKALRESHPDAYKEWQAGNSRFLQAIEQGRNPILC